MQEALSHTVAWDCGRREAGSPVGITGADAISPDDTKRLWYAREGLPLILSSGM